MRATIYVDDVKRTISATAPVHEIGVEAPFIIVVDGQAINVARCELDSLQLPQHHLDGVVVAFVISFADALVGWRAPDARAGEYGGAHVELHPHQKGGVALRGDAQVELGFVGRGEALGKSRGTCSEQEAATAIRFTDIALIEGERQPEGDGGGLDLPHCTKHVGAIHFNVECQVLCRNARARRLGEPEPPLHDEAAQRGLGSHTRCNLRGSTAWVLKREAKGGARQFEPGATAHTVVDAFARQSNCGWVG